MKILLKKNWFAPDGHRRRKAVGKAPTPIEVPDKWENILPPGTEILSEMMPNEGAEIGQEPAKLGPDQLSAQVAFKQKLIEEADKAKHSGVLEPDESGAAAAAQTAAAEADAARRQAEQK